LGSTAGRWSSKRLPPCSHLTTRLALDTNATHFSQGSYVVGRTYSMQHCQLGRSLEVPGRLPPPFLSDAPIRWSTCKGCYASIASTEFLEVRECEQQGVSATVKLPLVGIYSSKEVKSIAVYCFTQSIQPGKRDDARAIFEEIRTSRRDE
jgi:hypothetical protein